MRYELEAYLRQPGNAPVYFKPSFGSYGRGNAYVAGVEGERVLTGNMLAAVDIRTGRVCRAVAGIGLDQVENPRHPVSGREIVGFEIPHWRETLDLVENGQKAFPGFLCPGWDIAICQAGPRILEVNAFGDIDLPQHAYRTAFIDDAFVSLLKSRHLEGLLTAQSDNSTKSPLNSRIGIRRHHWQW